MSCVRQPEQQVAVVEIWCECGRVDGAQPGELERLLENALERGQVPARSRIGRDRQQDRLRRLRDWRVVELAWRQHDGGHTDGPNWKYFIPWADRFLKHSSSVPPRAQ